MKSLNRKMRKAFTLVELVVVIAIIAILSTVSVITYFGITNSAKASVDNSLITELNKCLQLDETLNGKPATPTDALAIVEENGFTVEKMTPTQDNKEIVWHQDTNKFELVEEIKASSRIKKAEGSSNISTWRFLSEYTANGGYSVYLKEGSEVTSLEITTGFDAGKNTGITTITYNGTANAVIRTNGASNLTINSEGSVSHYGEASSVKVEKAVNYKVAAKVAGNLTIKSAAVEVAETSVIGSVIIPNDATNVELKNNGTISVINTINAPESTVTINNTGKIDVSVGTTEISGNASSNKYEEVKTLTSDTHTISEGGYYDGDGVTIKSISMDTINGGNDRFALNVTTKDKVIINNVTLTGLRGIQLQYKDFGDFDFTLTNSTIQVKERGIQLWFSKGNNNSGTKLNVTNCIIENSNVTDYDTQYVNQHGGISITGAKDAQINISESTIQGFGYALQLNYHSTSGLINVNANATISNCVLKGRAGIDIVKANNSKIVTKNTSITGINTQDGTTESFGMTVIEGGENNTLEFNNCTFNGYRAPATDYNTEYLLDIRSKNNTISFVGKNTLFEEIYFNVDSEKVPTSYEELDKMISVADENTVLGMVDSATCIIIQGSKRTEYNWLLVK